MNLFVLTPEEKRVIAFAMLMILLGICVKEYRKRNPVPPVPIEVQKHPWMRKLPPLPSVTPQPSGDAGSATPRPKRARKPRKTPSVSPIPDEEQQESGARSTDQSPP